MRLFAPLTLRWWQYALLKLSMIALGILLGVYLHDFFLHYIAVVSVVFAVPGVYLVSMWLRRSPLSPNLPSNTYAGN